MDHSSALLPISRLTTIEGVNKRPTTVGSADSWRTMGSAAAGLIASPHPRPEPAGPTAPTETATPAPVAVSGTPEPATPTSAPSTAASTSGPKSNDAAEMLRVHNDLRAAIGAPAVRADDR